MRLDSTKEIHDIFTKAAQDTVHEAEKVLKLKRITPLDEENDNQFVLLYAFYKEIANYEHYRIPTYKEMKETFDKKRKDSLLLFAYYDEAPIAVVWISFSHKQVLLQALGSVRKGYELSADYFLMYHSILEAKERQAEELVIDRTFPRDEKRWKQVITDLHVLS